MPVVVAAAVVATADHRRLFRRALREAGVALDQADLRMLTRKAAPRAAPVVR